jgi:uncharacterized protein affecting Mg2+/Co2+ transport
MYMQNSAQYQRLLFRTWLIANENCFGDADASLKVVGTQTNYDEEIDWRY